MKITITQEFSTVEEAQAFLERVAGIPPLLTITPGAIINVSDLEAANARLNAETAAAGKTRKPRADAGKPRGPYKTGGAATPPTNAKPEGAGAPSGNADTPGTPAVLPTAAPQAGSAPAPTAAPSGAASNSAAPATSTPPDSKSAGAGAADLTLADVRGTLEKLSKVPGKGTEACIAALRAFNVLRISDLPKEKYVEFTKHVTGQIPA